MDPFESVISSIDRHYLSFESVMTGQPSKALNALFAGILPTPDPELSRDSLCLDPPGFRIDFRCVSSIPNPDSVFAYQLLMCDLRSAPSVSDPVLPRPPGDTHPVHCPGARPINRVIGA
jgi:hypothetical protein